MAKSDSAYESPRPRCPGHVPLSCTTGTPECIQRQAGGSRALLLLNRPLLLSPPPPTRSLLSTARGEKSAAACGHKCTYARVSGHNQACDTSGSSWALQQQCPIGGQAQKDQGGSLETEQSWRSTRGGCVPQKHRHRRSLSVGDSHKQASLAIQWPLHGPGGHAAGVVSCGAITVVTYHSIAAKTTASQTAWSEGGAAPATWEHGEATTVETTGPWGQGNPAEMWLPSPGRAAGAQPSPTDGPRATITFKGGHALSPVWAQQGCARSREPQNSHAEVHRMGSCLEAGSLKRQLN